jgi:hypothetical protein
VLHRLVATDGVLRARAETVPLALGGSLKLLPPDAAAGSVVRRLDDLIAPGKTLAVFPDAAGLNYATARASSIPSTVFNPFELQMTGEELVIQALNQSPPDFIAIVDTDESEYGAKTFGEDFGVAIRNWIDQHYSAVATEADSAHSDPDVRRIRIFRRR